MRRIYSNTIRSHYSTKIRVHNTPESISTSIKTNSEARVRCTRQDADLRLPAVRTEAGRRRFLYRGTYVVQHAPVGCTCDARPTFRALKRELNAGD